MLKRQLWLFLELLALTGFVVTQPLLDVIGRSPDFLLFRQADARDILLLGVAITVLPPLVLAALEALAGLAGRSIQRAVHLVLVAGLLGLLALEVAKRTTSLRGPLLVAVGVLVAAGAGLLYASKGAVVRLWLRYVSPAPLVFLLIFLLVSPAAELLRPAAASAGPSPAAAGDRPPGERPPIVYVLLDEFPLRSLLDQQGRIDRRQFPNFASLAADSTWYRNATGVAGLTNWAMPAMMTGRYPREDLPPIAARYPNNLFRLLGSSGYDMKVFEGVSQLCPPKTCTAPRLPSGRGGGFRGVVRDSAKVWAQMASPRDSATDPTATLEEATVDPNEAGAASSAGDKGFRVRPASFAGFMSALRPTGKPSVHFLHVLLPHVPWKYLPSGLKYPERTIGEGPLKGGMWTREPWPVQSGHQRHLMQTAYTDHLLGTVLERLRQTGMYDRSLVVVTADHGMSFTPGLPGRATVTDATVPDVLWVPLFIKRPHQRAPAVSDGNFESVDLTPTVAELAGLRVPWPVDGVSWADPKAAAARRARTEKWFYPRPDVRQVFPGPANHAVVMRGEADRVVPYEGDYLDWFRVGPNPDLVGRRVRELAVGAGGGAARVIDLDEYREVDPASGTVPAQVAGQLTSTAPGIPARPVVAVAVNGVIGGLSETFSSGDSPPTWFTAMVPDTLLRRGANQLQLYLVETTGGQPRLRPIALGG